MPHSPSFLLIVYANHTFFTIHAIAKALCIIRRIQMNQIQRSIQKQLNVLAVLCPNIISLYLINIQQVQVNIYISSPTHLHTFYIHFYSIFPKDWSALKRVGEVTATHLSCFPFFDEANTTVSLVSVPLSRLLVSQMWITMMMVPVSGKSLRVYNLLCSTRVS